MKPSLFITVFILFILITGLVHAQHPRVTPFIIADSLAVEFDLSELIDKPRLAKLDHGIPLSFRFDLSLRKPVDIWFDGTVDSRIAAFRIEINPSDGRYLCTILDFDGVSDSNRLQSTEGVLALLEDRLSGCIVSLDDISMDGSYYVSLEVDYRNLTYEDVRSADRWLRNRTPDKQDSTEEGTSIGDRFIGLLWDVAGLKGESRVIQTEHFIPRELRRADW